MTNSAPDSTFADAQAAIATTLDRLRHCSQLDLQATWQIALTPSPSPQGRGESDPLLTPQPTPNPSQEGNRNDSSLLTPQPTPNSSQEGNRNDSSLLTPQPTPNPSQEGNRNDSSLLTSQPIPNPSQEGDNSSLLTPHSSLLTPHLSPVTLNDRHHVAWEQGQKELWLWQEIVVPERLQDYPIAGLMLRLSLAWWADQAQVFVDGTLVQEGDLFDYFMRIVLSESVNPGDRFLVQLRLVSPGHDPGALVRSQCVYERSYPGFDPVPEPGFVADELAVLQRYVQNFAPEKLPVIAEVLSQIQWDALPNRDAFERSLSEVRRQLLPLGDWVRQRHIYPVGHAHLDMAWLWPVAETWEVAERTFCSALDLQQDFPEMIFSHSTPALYAWMEDHLPDLFAQIQQQVKSGSWEVAAGLWVEPEFNTVSGEAIARQILYGQHYVREKFGSVSRIAWLPDSFGFSWQLPQLLTQGGIEYFATQKLRWNDTTEFPYELFWWRSPDGSRILSVMLPPIGESIDPVKMADYACTWERSTGLSEAMWLPGIGDHGGGPTRDMLQLFQRWQRSPFFPQMHFTQAQQFLDQLGSRESGVGQPTPSPSQEGDWISSSHLAPHASLSTQPTPSPSQEGDWISSSPLTPHSSSALTPNPSPQGRGESDPLLTPHSSLLTSFSSLPTWSDELYLELHRGCYTVHGDQKWFNRRCEGMLYQAEVFASLASWIAGVEYPLAELEQAWKRVLFNQFHDILPGSSIPQVFEDANLDWLAALDGATQVLDQSLRAIASRIQKPNPPTAEARPILVINPLSWRRSQVVSYKATSGQVLDLEGQPVPSQVDEAGNLLFFAQDIPAIGYKLFWLDPIPEKAPASIPAELSYGLENECLRVIVDPDTGDLASVVDLRQQREILSAPGNQLQAFGDRGQYWDAWNIAPDYADHPLPATKLQSIQWCDRGSLRQRIRVVRSLGQSTFTQDYCLDHQSPILKIITQVDWQETQVVVKAAFPLVMDSDQVTSEIPFGAIARPTRPQTEAEKAKWEVPALHWSDLSQSDYGVSVLNDSKYGYDAQPNQLRLTLLKAPLWPDPNADRGQHEFTYALYPHVGSWQVADTVHQGYELNHPLHVLPLSDPITETANLPPTQEFLRLPKNLILSALKRSQSGDSWILRCYECLGESATFNKTDLGAISQYLDLEMLKFVNLLEDPVILEPDDLAEPVAIAPWKIITLALRPLDPKPPES